MTEPIVLNLGGVDKLWHFNNYALYDLSKALGVETTSVDAAVMQMADEDILAAFTYLVHFGLVGYEKSQANFKHGLQIKDVAQIIATADDNQLLQVWEAFKAATGISDFLATLPKEDQPDEKKNKSTGKRSSNTLQVKSA